MGYNTLFVGEFELDRLLATEHHVFLTRFSHSRRILWDEDQVQHIPDHVRQAAGLPVGVEGAFVLGYEYDGIADEPPFLIDYDKSPAGQPSLWCNWTPSEEGTKIIWNGREKFYSFVEWLDYLIEEFLRRWGYLLNGKLVWQGQDPLDLGTISIIDNFITIYEFND
jgi:hypothetical protein